MSSYSGVTGELQASYRRVAGEQLHGKVMATTSHANTGHYGCLTGSLVRKRKKAL